MSLDPTSSTTCSRCKVAPNCRASSRPYLTAVADASPKSVATRMCLSAIMDPSEHKSVQDACQMPLSHRRWVSACQAGRGQHELPALIVTGAKCTGTRASRRPGPSGLRKRVEEGAHLV